MSIYYYLVCKETKEFIWVGQGGPCLPHQKLKMETFYSGEEKTMHKLKCFLNRTRGKELVFSFDSEELDNYKEFKLQQPIKKRDKDDKK